MARKLSPVQLAERIVMVLKVIEDLEIDAQREVLEAVKAVYEEKES